MRAPFAVIFLLALGCGAASLRADEVPAARAYFNVLLAGLDRIERELPLLAAQAERDAPRLIAGEPFTVRGDRGLAVELSARPGAMQAYLGHPPAAQAKQVIYEATDEEPALCAARAWVYQVELFAACVRRGSTPVIRQSIELDTRRRRLLRYGSQMFHHDRWPAHAAPGELGRTYLDGLRRVLRDIGTAGWPGVAAACRRAAEALDAGGRIRVVTGPSMLAYHLPQPFEPWDGRAARRDLVLAVGDHQQAGYHGHWHELDVLRASGGIAWILNAYNTQPGDVQRGEILIDLWAPVGDGVVRVEHYDARLGPVTGVAQLAVVYAIAQHCRGTEAGP